MILGLATSRSLVLVDELGRGTSPTEGVGISHAIAEEMIDTGVSAYDPVLLTVAHLLIVFRVLCHVRTPLGPTYAMELIIYSHFHELSTTLSRQPTVVKYALLDLSLSCQADEAF